MIYLLIIGVFIIILVCITANNKKKVNELKANQNVPIVIHDLSNFTPSDIKNRAGLLTLEAFLRGKLDNIEKIDVAENILSSPGEKKVTVYYTNGKYEMLKVYENVMRFSFNQQQDHVDIKPVVTKPVETLKERIEKWFIKYNFTIEQLEETARKSESEIFCIPAKIIGDDPEFVKELSIALSDRGHLFVQPDDSGLLIDVT